MKQAFEFTQRAQRERAFLIGVSLPNLPLEKAHEHLDELAQLAETAGAEVVGRSVQGRTRIDGATYIGSGKAEELKETCANLDANLIVFDDDLSPAQSRTLEKLFKINIIDRTELILDIFARHAKTQQSKIQVELAQLQYALPRLTRLWEHLSRQAGGIGLRGPGETQLEVDRRRIRTRMGALRRQLKKVETRREMLRQGRNGQPMVALVGYTNAGKSTLMQRLSGADIYVKDQLFATLDTVTRKVPTRNHGDILAIDTVGFIRKLPDHLATSFKATLEDTARADLFLHVIDASHPAYEEQMEVTDVTLRSIEKTSEKTGEKAGKKAGIETIHVFNKTDRLSAVELSNLQTRFPDAVFVSALEGNGVDAVIDRVEQAFFGNNIRVEVTIPAGDGKCISAARLLLHNIEQTFVDDLCVLGGTIESTNMGRLESIAGTTVKLLL